MKKEDDWKYHLVEWLLIAGGLNWGLALFGFNLVAWLAGVTFGFLEPVVYGAVGLSALYLGYLKLPLGK
jgi:uncharacterized membrane protein YuzA (DUF378 family)